MRCLIFLIFVFFIMNTTGCQDEKELSPREPAQAGRFYPDEPNKLIAMINQALAQAKDVPGEFPRALIVPHAGYEFSGRTAAYAYKILQTHSSEVKRVILLAPSHYAYIKGVVINERSYKTPLGVYQVDRKALAELEKLSFPRQQNEVASTQEHSDEVQIPFLQTVLPKAQLVPVIVGELNETALESTAKALSTVVDQHTVIVVSSDFTHYGPRFDYTPRFQGDKRTGIFGLDQGAIDCIRQKNSKQFQEYLHKTGATICGKNPIAVLLKMIEINHWPGEAVVLKQTASGDLTGDWENSVSYVAMAFGELRPSNAADQKLLNSGEERTLLKLSRMVLNNFITSGTPEFPESSLKSFELTGVLKQELGVFVTLKEHGKLRGCIGYIMGFEPLYRGVIENTQNAAARDPRFPKVTPTELPQIEIEISVLSPLEKVRNLDEIKVGRDGLVLKTAFNSGVFLPQVPVEQNWDKTTYLEQLGLKAGLTREAYKNPGTELFRFSAQVFGE